MASWRLFSFSSLAASVKKSVWKMPGSFTNPIGGEGQAADRQLGIGDAVEQSRSRGLQLAAQVGGRLQSDAAVAGLGQGAAIPVDLHRATVTAAVAVFPVVADVQCKPVGDKPLIHQLVDQTVGHLLDDQTCFFTGIGTGEHLPFAEAVRFRLVGR